MFRLPPHLRNKLKRPFGTLHRSLESVLPEIGERPVYAVGDVVTYRLLRHNVRPAVAIVDGMSMRSPCEKRPNAYAPVIRACNPAGTITRDLMKAIEKALESTPSIIFVEGEEDLAVLPLVIAAPEGGVLLYGQPDAGVVMRVIDGEAKAEARSILSEFIEEENSGGCDRFKTNL